MSKSIECHQNYWDRYGGVSLMYMELGNDLSSGSRHN